MHKQFCKNLERCEATVKRLSSDFLKHTGVTVFAYVRVYDDGKISWVTSNADQDQFLLESSALQYEPKVGTKNAVSQGNYLWFCDRKFPGSDVFYKERAKRFEMDHGMVLVRHQKEYLETCCFSGLLSKRPLYNLFMNEQVLFHSFMDHFVSRLDRDLLSALTDGLELNELKESTCKSSSTINREAILATCGLRALLELSCREKECLLLFRKGYTYEKIGKALHLSARTVEHYLESVKNKLNIESRPELYAIAEKLL